MHCTGYGASAVYSSSLVSCPFCVWSAVEESRWRKTFTSRCPATHLPAVSAPGRMVGEVGGLVLTETAAQVLCWVSCRTARARSVRALVRHLNGQGRTRSWYGAESVRDVRGKEWDRH